MTRTSPLRAVLFDLDGTLVDSAPSIATALSEIRRARGGEGVSAADVRPLISLGASELVKRALGPATRRDAGGDLAVFRDTLARLPTDPGCLYPGASALIESLGRANIAIAIVTNKPEKLSRKLLADLNLMPSSRVVVGGDTTPWPKPHPAPILAALTQLDVDRVHAIFVGDSIVDARAAEAARLPFHLFLEGYGAAGCIGVPVASWFASHAELSSTLIRRKK